MLYCVISYDQDFTIFCVKAAATSKRSKNWWFTVKKVSLRSCRDRKEHNMYFQLNSEYKKTLIFAHIGR